jgi:4-amino-4-deoxy-L-arabinose transferase-like glycosyltransferase
VRLIESTMTAFKYLRHHSFAIVIGIWLVLLRLVTAASIPLMETTEARYGEIARKMLETGNWLYLQNTYDSPFWAKPPLYAWLSAASMGILGVNELAARLPAILLGIATVYLTYLTMRRELNAALAVRASLVLATLVGFLLGMGALMTDPSLVFCVTLSLCSWWNFHTSNEKKWGLLFFAGIGAGLLAKGPLALVLIGLPIFFYLLVCGGWAAAVSSLPWALGSVIAFALPAAWYLLVEFKTPGFIAYFVLGEHVYRFLKPGWAGDLYGNAHHQPYGTIWLYAAAGLLPWSLLLTGYFFQAPRALLGKIRSRRFLVFLGLWCLTPLVFFSAAANIVWPYFLPMAPAFAMLCAVLIDVRDNTFQWFIAASVAVISAVSVFASDLILKQNDEHTKSAKRIIARWQAQERAADERLAYYSKRRIYSAEFYTNGKIRWAKTPESVAQLISDKQIDYLIANAPEYDLLSEGIRKQFVKLPGYPPTPLALEIFRRR